MNTVTITASTLIVEPRGLDKLWSLTSRITIPLEHVRGATVDPGANRESKGLRAPGLGLPNKSAGTFYRDGERSFWNVSNSDRTIVVELRDERFARLVLTVADPRQLVDSINTRVTPS
jgi:hypothetical protein